MKAVIMAGGQGSRLRPLTTALPKPMARLCGRPIVEYILELLAQNGITESILTLQYMPDVLRNHLGKEFAGIALSYSEEETPLGTAGSVKQALEKTQEPVLIISGDALCDFSLTDAIRAHEESKATVTIVSTRVADPREYGLVLADKDSRVTGFVEKPSYAQAVSELANTGIYILSPEAVDKIPPQTKYDFACDLFPKLLQEGHLIHNCTLEGYWCDIGDLAAYRMAQMDMLQGKVNCRLRGERDYQGNVIVSRRPTGRYEISPPVFIGEGVHIGENAVIGACSVLDDGCTVASGATVSESILLERCMVGQRAGVLSSVVCSGAAVKSKASLFAGAAVGNKAVIGSSAVVCENVRVAGGVRVADRTIVAEHIGERGSVASAFDDDGLSGEIGVELTPELAVRVGCALGSIARGRTIGFATADARSAQVLGSALMAGVRACGADVMDFGQMFQAMFSFSMSYNALELGVYISAGSRSGISIVGVAGLPASRKTEREVEIAMSRGEYSRVSGEQFGARTDMSGAQALYAGELLRLAPEGLYGMHARVSCKNPAVRMLLRDVLGKLGCADGGPELLLSEDGMALTMREGSVVIEPHRTVAAHCMMLFEKGQDAAVGNDFPRALDQFAQKYGRTIKRYLLCPADNTDADARALAAQQPGARDGLMLAVQMLDYMKRGGLTLEAAARLLPAFAVEETAVDIDQPPARLLKALKGEHAGEGIVVRGEKGVVLLRPRKSGNAIRVFAEAASWETAQELCIDFTRRLDSLLDKNRAKE